MKKLMSCLLLLFLMSGCATNTQPVVQEEKKEEVKEDKKIVNYEEQVQILVDNQKEWENAFKDQHLENMNANSFYYITDLDQNGLIKLNIEIMQATGKYTSRVVYEVSEDLKDITLLQTNLETDIPDGFANLQPKYYADKGSVQTYTGYYNKENNQFIYFTYDYVRAGWEEDYVSFSQLIKEGNELKYTNIASSTTTRKTQQDEGTTTYTINDKEYTDEKEAFEVLNNKYSKFESFEYSILPISLTQGDDVYNLLLGSAKLDTEMIEKLQSEKEKKEKEQTKESDSVVTKTETTYYTSFEMNVRSKPSKDASIVNVLKEGTKVIVYEITTNSDGSVWGKVSDGYICIQDNGNVYLSESAPVQDTNIEQSQNDNSSAGSFSVGQYTLKYGRYEGVYGVAGWSIVLNPDGIAIFTGDFYADGMKTVNCTWTVGKSDFAQDSSYAGQCIEDCILLSGEIPERLLPISNDQLTNTGPGVIFVYAGN